jgi:hypothetical protein
MTSAGASGANPAVPGNCASPNSIAVAILAAQSTQVGGGNSRQDSVGSDAVSPSHAHRPTMLTPQPSAATPALICQMGLHSSVAADASGIRNRGDSDIAEYHPATTATMARRN